MLPEGKIDNAAETQLRQVCAELDRCLRGGKACCAEELLKAHPAIGNDADAALEVIYTEYVLRKELGEEPSLPDLYLRFPQWRQRLERLFHVHAALADDAQIDFGPTLVVAPLPTNPSLGGPAATAFSPYVLIEEIGRGGMGVVYKAQQVGLNRIVALKMILAGTYAAPEELSRFRTEADAAARFQHPHIVQIYEVGERDGLPFLALEFVNGGNLAKKLADTPMPGRQAAELIATLARAIHYAHQHGIVHRDLKPSNVLLSAEGVPKIADFGLAVQLAGSGGASGADATQTGAVLGTPSYMAPEQAEGNRHAIGPATDIYALGAIFYEALVGRPPFLAENPLETLEQVRSHEPLLPTHLLPKLAPDLETICLKCLQKDPRKRYASAEALADDLRRFLDGEPIHARPTGKAERLWRWCRRKPVLAALSALVIVLGAVVLLGTPLAALLWREQRDLARANFQRAELAEKQMTERLWESLLDQARLGLSSRDAGSRAKGLAALKQAAEIRSTLTLRNTAIACLTMHDLPTVLHWDWDNPPDNGLAFDAGLENFAYKDKSGNISVRRAADQREIISLASGAGADGQVGLIAFSPDGKYLAALFSSPPQPKSPASGRCLVWQWRAGAKLLDVPAQRSVPLNVGLDFSPDSRHIAILGVDGSIGFYDCAAGKEFRRLARTCVAHALRFDPAGERLAVSSFNDPKVEIRDAATGKVEKTLAHPAGVFQCAWRGDGTVLATGCDDRKVHVWDTVAGAELAVIKGHLGGVLDVAFNHGGDLLATRSRDLTTRLWDPHSGQHLLTAPGDFLRFGPDDDRLAFVNGPQIGLWAVAGHRECRTLRHARMANLKPSANHGGPWSADFSADGRWLATAGGDGVRVWDTVTGTPLAHLPLGWSESALFQPRSGRLITYGMSRIQDWPIHVLAEPGSSTFELGPPTTVFEIEPRRILEGSVDSYFLRSAFDQNGGIYAFINAPFRQATVLHWNLPDKPIKRTPLAHMILSAALSPNGEWLACGMYKAGGVHLAKTKVGNPAHFLPLGNPAGSSANVAFSPDGQWLVTAEQDAYRFWQVGSWEAGRIFPRKRLFGFPGPLAFSRDGRMLALCWAPEELRLVDQATGQELATLPIMPRINGLSFSRDGKRLAVATDNHMVQLWDLERIRKELAGMNLNW